MHALARTTRLRATENGFFAAWPGGYPRDVKSYVALFTYALRLLRRLYLHIALLAFLCIQYPIVTVFID